MSIAIAISAAWSRWWTNHGTKIVGFFTAAVAALEYADEQTIKAMEFVFGAKHGPMVSHGIVAFSGLMAAKRGFTNSKKQTDAQPAQPT